MKVILDLTPEELAELQRLTKSLNTQWTGCSYGTLAKLNDALVTAQGIGLTVKVNENGNGHHEAKAPRTKSVLRQPQGRQQKTSKPKGTNGSQPGH